MTTGGHPLMRFSLPWIPLPRFLAYVHQSGGFSQFKKPTYLVTILETLVVVSVHNINIHLMHAGNFEAVYEI